jgi:hypothetical protein
MAGGRGCEVVFMTTAHRWSITSGELSAEYREGAPCSSRTGERGDFPLPNAEEPQTVLWQRGSALHYVQLLPSICLAGNGAGSERFRESAGRSSQEVWIRSGWLCGDARARAFADWGIEEGVADNGGAQSKAARVKEDAARQLETVTESRDASVSRKGRSVAPILAKTVLRF